VTENVAAHYAGGDLVAALTAALHGSAERIAPADLAAVDEFHIRGRDATLELAERMKLAPGALVLDIGSGLGGPARTLAEAYRCRVVGVDLTLDFCRAARVLSAWVKLDHRVALVQGDATRLPFADRRFDAALTFHVAMNIPAKDRLYREARRVLKPRARFVAYDVLAGEGGDPLFPVPWARDPAISHLATPQAMESLLREAGFTVLAAEDSTAESQRWFEAMAGRAARAGPPRLTFQLFLGDDFPVMVRNQIRNLAERRIRTVSYLCEA